MIRVPGIYGDLSDDARAAYDCWMLALFAHAEHAMRCAPCRRDTSGACPEGLSVADAEVQRWRVWDALRPREVQP